MKRILENGYNEYKRVCDNCGCIFTYELEDIDSNSIQCPYCDYELIHKYTFANITNDPECNHNTSLDDLIYVPWLSMNFNQISELKFPAIIHMGENFYYYDPKDNRVDIHIYMTFHRANDEYIDVFKTYPSCEDLIHRIKAVNETEYYFNDDDWKLESMKIDKIWVHELK